MTGQRISSRRMSSRMAKRKSSTQNPRLLRTWTEGCSVPCRRSLRRVPIPPLAHLVTRARTTLTRPYRCSRKRWRGRHRLKNTRTRCEERRTATTVPRPVNQCHINPASTWPIRHWNILQASPALLAFLPSLWKLELQRRLS